MNKNKRIYQSIFVLVFLFVVLFYFNTKLHFIKGKVYTAKDFSIKEIKSNTDFDQDKIDDYHDFVISARKYIEKKPKYKNKYYIGGYPDGNVGVCTDVIWNAFQGAGYTLKELVDQDILLNQTAYPKIKTIDPNIDFRRVETLKIYFDRHATKQTLDIDKIKEWQPGDIVLFKNHIAIVSDKRNKQGIPYIIHHDGWGAREADDMKAYKVVGHYRWEK